MALTDFGSWIERVYGEDDFGRNIAIAAAGAAGLGAYSWGEDSVRAAFVAVMVFPVVKVVASSWHSKRKQSRERSDHTDQTKRLFESLSSTEQAVVRGFVSHGGCVVRSRDADRSAGFHRAGIDSLIKRKLINVPLSFDPNQATFELSPELFDYAQTVVTEDLPDYDDIPF